MEGPPSFNRRQRRRALRFALIGNVVPIAIATATNFSFAPDGSSSSAQSVPASRRSFVTAVPRRHRIVFYLAAFGGIPALTMMQAYTGAPHRATRCW